MTVGNVVKILIQCFLVIFFQRNEVYYCFDGNYQTATRRVMARISLSRNEWRSNFLALAVPDPVKTEMTIAYHGERNGVFIGGHS